MSFYEQYGGNNPIQPLTFAGIPASIWPVTLPPQRILIVKVGSDHRPASEADLQAVQDQLTELLGDASTVKAWVTPHDISLSIVDVANGTITNP